MINETRRPDGLNFSTSAIEKGFRIIAQTGNDVMRWNSQFGRIIVIMKWFETNKAVLIKEAPLPHPASISGRGKICNSPQLFPWEIMWEF